MSVIFLEGFDHYQGSDSIVGWQSRWTTASADKTLITGRFGTGQGIQIAHNGGEEDLFATLPKHCSTITTGFAAQWSYYGTESTVMRWCDSSSTVLVDLNIASDGTFKLYADGNSTPFATSPSGYVRAGIWYYIEVALTIATNNTGTAQVWLEGDKIIDVSGIPTSNKTSSTGANTVAMVEAMTYINYDDIYVTDNLTPLGGCRITSYFPASDQAGSGWTPSTAGTSLFAEVNGTTASATKYITANTTGAQQLFGVAGLPTFTNVHAVQVLTFNTKDNSGFRKAAAVISDGTNTKVGDNFIVSSSPTYVYQIFDTNAQSAAWSNADMQTISFGVKVTQ